MPDFLKKAGRQLAKVTEDGEEPVAALFVRPRVAGETRRLGAPAGTLGKLQGSDHNGPDAADTVPEAPRIEHNSVLVLTDRRLLVFEHGALLGRVKALSDTIPLGEIAAMHLEVPETSSAGPATLEISFRDGSATVVTPGSRRKQFVAAFERAGQSA